MKIKIYIFIKILDKLSQITFQMYPIQRVLLTIFFTIRNCVNYALLISVLTEELTGYKVYILMKQLCGQRILYIIPTTETRYVSLSFP